MPIQAFDVHADSLGLPVKFLRIPAGSAKQVVFCLRDARGDIVDITKSDAIVPVLSQKTDVSPGRVEIKLVWTVEPLGARYQIYCEVLPDHPGHIVGYIEKDHTQYVGIHKATIGQFLGDILIQQWPLYLYIEPSAFQTIDTAQPLTVAEVRLSLFDFYKPEEADQHLLTDVEVSDIEILHAMQRCVDLWNETPPPVAFYTTRDFPYRYWWTVGTTGLIFRTLAARYRRNSLAYSAGGVSINDREKQVEYETLAEQRLKSFNDWMMTEKISINRGFCWRVGI